MPSSASSLLKVELQANGENTNTWGAKANAVFERLEQAIAGEAAITVTTADVTLSDTDYTGTESHKAYIKATGALTGNRSVIVPARTKIYFVSNETSGSYTLTVKTSGGTGVAVTQSKKAILYCDGTNVVKVFASDDYAELSTANTFTADQTFRSSDAGASAGPLLTLDRNSASAADGDVLGAVVANGRDDGGGTDVYAQMQAEIVDSAAGSEDGIWNFLTKVAGTLASRVKVGAGLFLGAATDPGAGKVNADDLQVSGTSVMLQGKHTVNLPAGCWTPATTSGCAAVATDESTTYDVITSYLAFDKDAVEYAHTSFGAPVSFDESAGFTAEIEWKEAAGASSHLCAWAIEMQAQGDGDTIDSAWGTAVQINDTGTSGTRRLTATSGTITPGGSWAAGDKILVRLSRVATDETNDTLNVDAHAIEVRLHPTIAAGNDAP